MKRSCFYILVAMTLANMASATTASPSYAYDALGRRIVSNIGGTVTRYYYDRQNSIEEYGWDGSAETGRLRYHVHGSQYIDERVATYADGTGQFTYYLLADNYSVAGTGSAGESGPSLITEADR